MIALGKSPYARCDGLERTSGLGCRSKYAHARATGVTS